jgi:hypothetical protein
LHHDFAPWYDQTKGLLKWKETRAGALDKERTERSMAAVKSECAIEEANAVHDATFGLCPHDRNDEAEANDALFFFFSMLIVTCMQKLQKRSTT